MSHLKLVIFQHICLYLQSRSFLPSKVVFLENTRYTLIRKKKKGSPKLLKINLNRKKVVLQTSII